MSYMIISYDRCILVLNSLLLRLKSLENTKWNHL